jgi:hypothetical protein
MAVAHVQTTETKFNSSLSTVTTSAVSYTGGNLLICTICGFHSGATVQNVSTVKLNGTTAFSSRGDTGVFTSGSSNIRIQTYYLENVAGGSSTVTVTWAGAVDVATVYVTEVSGAATSSSTDGVGASASGTSTTPASGAFSASSSTDFWIGAVCGPFPANPATMTAGAGWTIPAGGKETNGSSFLVSSVEYMANPGATSENAQWTTDSGFWVASVYPFKAAGAAAGPTFPQLERGIRGLMRGVVSGSAS